MRGIFLHVLADTLGSVAVVISTLLIHFYSWPGFDPLASCMIAILIFASAVPLVISSAKTLLLTIPADTEYCLREALIGVSSLRGVASYRVPKFWLDDREEVHAAASHDHHHGHDHDHSHNSSHHHDGNGIGSVLGGGNGHAGPGGTPRSSPPLSSSQPTTTPAMTTKVLGVIHIVASRGTDMEEVRQRVVAYLRDRGVDAVVQVEREGESRCWCATGMSPPPLSSSSSSLASSVTAAGMSYRRQQ